MFAALLCAAVLANDAVRVEFSDADKGFAVASIVNRLDGETRFVNSPDKGFDLWHLTFHGVDGNGQPAEASSRSRLYAARKSCEKRDGELVLRWEGMGLNGEKNVLDVTVTVRLCADGESRWRIKVDNRSRRWTLAETRFPCIAEVMRPGEGDVLEAASPLGAQLHCAFAGREEMREVKFPTTAPPVTAFMSGGRGLYIGIHDPERPITRFRYGPGLDFAVSTPVENAGVPGKAAEGPGFEVVMRPFKGDWWQVARMYRDWAMRQKWTAKGPIAGRADFPQSFKELDVCTILSEPRANAASNKIAAIVRAFPGLKLGIHWYWWHNSEFCGNTPEFFPAKKGVPEVMRAWTKAGVLMMPYTNPRLWDTNQASWVFAKDHACRNWKGGYSTIAYRGYDCAVMCPSSEKWRQSAWSWSGRALDELGANAIYYDQVAVACPFECFDRRHGHPVGGGTWWTDGYRKMLEPMHALFSSRNAPITSELSGDSWLDLIDGYLLCGAPHDDEVPFFPAVYSGYAIYFGSEENMCDPEDTFESWQYRQFTWGVLPGWFDRWDIGDRKYARQQKIIARLARIRRAAAEFMVYGRLVDEVRFTTEQPLREYPMKYLWRPEKWVDKVHMPDVHGTVWKNNEGTTHAVFVANAAAVERKVSFRLPCKGLSAVIAHDTADVRYGERNGIGELVLPAHGIAFLTNGKNIERNR